MNCSEKIDELAKALSKAQSVVSHAVKDSNNPHFKSKYAGLASVWEAIRQPLTANGLSVVQCLGSECQNVKCLTMLMHESGQFISSEFVMTPQQNTPQSVGSCATYLRRYSLMAMVGVAPDDDDGNEATNRGNNYGSKDHAGVAAKATTSSSTQGSVGSQLPENKPDTHATVISFDSRNIEHTKKIAAFLAEKKRNELFSAMCKKLEGKPLTHGEVLKQFNEADLEQFVDQEGVK
jgi:hypothetical protein